MKDEEFQKNLELLLERFEKIDRKLEKYWMTNTKNKDSDGK